MFHWLTRTELGQSRLIVKGAVVGRAFSAPGKDLQNSHLSSVSHRHSFDSSMEQGGWSPPNIRLLTKPVDRTRLPQVSKLLLRLGESPWRSGLCSSQTAFLAMLFERLRAGPT
jgi:hypothetical protein